MTIPSREFLVRQACYNAINRELGYAPGETTHARMSVLFSKRFEPELMKLPLASIEKYCKLIPLIRDEFDKLVAAFEDPHHQGD